MSKLWLSAHLSSLLCLFCFEIAARVPQKLTGQDAIIHLNDCLKYCQIVIDNADGEDPTLAIELQKHARLALEGILDEGAAEEYAVGEDAEVIEIDEGGGQGDSKMQGMTSFTPVLPTRLKGGLATSGTGSTLVSAQGQGARGNNQGLTPVTKESRSPETERRL